MVISLIVTENLMFILLTVILKQFDNNFKINVKPFYVLNIESEKINKLYLLYYIDCLKLQANKFHNINQMIINTISDRCNGHMNSILIIQ